MKPIALLCLLAVLSGCGSETEVPPIEPTTSIDQAPESDGFDDLEEFADSEESEELNLGFIGGAFPGSVPVAEAPAPAAPAVLLFIQLEFIEADLKAAADGDEEAKKD